MPWVGSNNRDIIKVFNIGAEPLVIENLAYDVDGNPIYHGCALQGAGDDEAKWRIKKLTWTDGVLVSARYSKPNQVWDDRASLTYT